MTRHKKYADTKQVHILEGRHYESGDSEDEISHNYALSLDKTHYDANSPKKIQKLFVPLTLSKDGSCFEKLNFQVDTAASCNTMTFQMFQKIGSLSDLSPSKSLLHTYSGSIIKPLGKFTALCESKDKFDTLDFEVISDEDIKDKPALLGNLIIFHPC